MTHIFGTMTHIFGTTMHISGTMAYIFGTMTHIFCTRTHIFCTMRNISVTFLAPQQTFSAPWRTFSAPCYIFSALWRTFAAPWCIFAAPWCTFWHHDTHFWHHDTHFWHHDSHLWHNDAHFWHHGVPILAPWRTYFGTMTPIFCILTQIFGPMLCLFLHGSFRLNLYSPISCHLFLFSFKKKMILGTLFINALRDFFIGMCSPLYGMLFCYLHGFTMIYVITNSYVFKLRIYGCCKIA